MPQFELFIGLVAPIGVNLDRVSKAIAVALMELKYNVEEFKLTDLMRQFCRSPQLDPSIEPIARYDSKITQANSLRETHGASALSLLGMGAVRNFRQKAVGNSDFPIAAQAYIFRQLKTPAEVDTLRQVYGRQFVLISAFAPAAERLHRLKHAELKFGAGSVTDVDADHRARLIIDKDFNELAPIRGQNVRDTFPLADLFVDASTDERCTKGIRRFFYLLFGSNRLSPTRDEYGMYTAKSASLRSLDLSRQVGAAIFRSTGEIVSIGCNEVPAPGGGTYWEDDENDGRDFRYGYDSNERYRSEVLADLINRFHAAKLLNSDLQGRTTGKAAYDHIMAEDRDEVISKSKLMDIIEFGRMIHAEMSAIVDAARLGIATKGSTMFCTTFPCHVCAKHIVAAGLTRVVYVEPYAKSYAAKLHGDSISVDDPDAPLSPQNRVRFESFIGVSPRRYRDLFERGRRKHLGEATEWKSENPEPLLDYVSPVYAEREAEALAALGSSPAVA